MSTKLLVIWGWHSYGLYSHVWLIEHKNTLAWNEEKLKKLYDRYDSQSKVYFVIGRWLLDDDTILKTKFEVSRGGFEINITISEEKDLLQPIKPLWIDPNR
jgi:hypothetical protein